MLEAGRTLETAAAKADMDPKTARKYRQLRKLPSELKVPRSWRTRKNPFEEVWPGIQGQLEVTPGFRRRRCSRGSSGSAPAGSRTGSCGRCSGR